MIEKNLKLIQESVNKNKDCIEMPLFLNSKVFYIDNGYLGSCEQEVLCLISGNNYGKYFYAHIFKSSEKTSKWYSLIIWANELIESNNINSLFKRYSEVIKNVRFSPCRIQEDWQTYAESKTFEEACYKLIKMINNYDLEKRLYDDQNNIYDSFKYEMRVFAIS